MSLPVAFRRLAQAEFDDAAEWYENQQPGLGGDFVAEVQVVLDTISNQPDRYPAAEDDIREAPVARFPYCVYYRAQPTRVMVIAVFHTSRDPAEWQNRA
jgi:plasmid stabilization system protein ParE